MAQHGEKSIRIGVDVGGKYEISKRGKAQLILWKAPTPMP